MRILGSLRTFALLAFVFSLFSNPSRSTAQAATATVADSSPNQIILSAEAEDLIAKVNASAALGYRVRRAEGGRPVSVLMQRTAADSFQYALMRAPRLPGKMKAALVPLGEKGYHILPNTFMNFGRKGAFAPPDYGVLMERSSRESGKYEYRISAPMSHRKVQKDIDTAGAEGFRPVMVGWGFAVLERSTGAAAVSPGTFRYLEIDRVKDRDSMISQLSGNGYKLLEAVYAPAGDYIAGGNQEPAYILLLKKSDVVAEYKNVEVATRFDKNDPQNSARQQLAAYELALNDAGKQGFQVVVPFLQLRFRVFGTRLNFDFSAIMEKTGEHRYEYRLLMTDDPASFRKKLDESAAEGFHLARGGFDDEDALLEREILPVAPGATSN